MVAANTTHTISNGTSKIKPWGNSQGIRLGKNIMEQAGWKTEDEIHFDVLEGNKIMLRLAQPKDDGSLAFLFKGFKDDGIREKLIDFGESVGNEVFD
jgi:Growth regulator